MVETNTKSHIKKNKSLCKAKKKIAVVGCAILLVAITCIMLIPPILNEIEPQKCFKEKFYEKGNFSEIRLNEIKLRGSETYIDSNIFIRLEDTEDPGNVYVIVKDSNHPYSQYKLQGEYDSEIKAYEGRRDIELYPEKGSMLYFPFDNLSFNFSTKIASKIDLEKDIKEIHLYQNINGFILKGPPKYKLENKSIGITFDLDRKIYCKALLIVLATFILVYIVIIIGWVHDTNQLITSILTFFVSIWALRAVVTPFIKGVSYWVDIFFLFLSIALLFLILTKSIIRKL